MPGSTWVGAWLDLGWCLARLGLMPGGLGDSNQLPRPRFFPLAGSLMLILKFQSLSLQNPLIFTRRQGLLALSCAIRPRQLIFLIHFFLVLRLARPCLVPGSTWFGAWGSQKFKAASQTPLFSFSGVSHANFEIPIHFPSKSTNFHKKAGSFCTFLRNQTPASLFS